MRKRNWCLPVALLVGNFVLAAQHDDVDANYYAYVAAESEDTVHLVRFGPNGGEVVKTVIVGTFATEIEGPHGIRVSPDGKHWYVSIAHGQPFGSVYKYEAGDDISVGDVQVGLYPATMDISPTTGLMLVANFNLHGDMEPGSLSVIDTVSMMEVAQIEQGVMPHGSRTSPDGRFHYSVGMMDDALYEVDIMKLSVGRKLHLTPDDDAAPMAHEGHHMAVAKPTWVQPHPSEPYVYVALQGVNQVAEVSLEDWKITRRFHTQKGPYNLAISPNGKILIATCKTNDSIAVWDLERGEELANIPSSRRITHGVTITPDNRFAFITVEGIGDDPGTVDVIDLESFATRASIDIGKQASGIDFWKMEPVSGTD